MLKLSMFFYRAVAFILAALFSAGLPVQVHIHTCSLTVTAHSGCMGLADNSIEAMEAGVDAGADIVEFDLHFTASGDPVLSHDAPNAEQTYVTLEDAFRFLSEHKETMANIDVKNAEHIETIPPLAARFGVEDRIFMTGIGENDIAAAKEKCPGIPYYLNVSVDEETDIQALIDKTLGLGAIGINLYWEGASRRLIRDCHRSGLLVSVWTVNELQPIIELALMGADNITTRQPEIACSVLG